ncbi:hypothetical protein EMIT0P258_190045 [Pseudomonas sp. IT-P258]
MFRFCLSGAQPWLRLLRALPDPPNPSPLDNGQCSARSVAARLHFALGEVTVAVVDGFEFAAVDGDDRLREEIKVATKHYELPADAANGFAVVLAKVGDGFEVRSQTARQPHQLDVALGLTFKPATGLNPIKIDVDIDLQQDRWMVGRTALCSRINTFKLKCTQVEFIDENVDHSHWIFLSNIIVQALRQQRDLRPSFTFNESLHDRPRHDLDDQKIRQSQAFSHSLGRKWTVSGDHLKRFKASLAVSRA